MASPRAQGCWAQVNTANGLEGVGSVSRGKRRTVSRALVGSPFSALTP